MTDFFDKAKKATLGEKIDELAKLDVKMARAARLLKAREAKWDACAAELMELFNAAELTSASGSNGASAKLVKKDFPGISDRELFNAYVKENDAFDLFTAKVNSKAYKVRAEAGENVPGVSIFSKTAVKLN